MKSKWIKFLMLTICFLVIILAILFLYWFSNINVLKKLVLPLSIAVAGTYMFFAFKIFKKTKHKKPITQVDTTKVKEFGTSRWLQNELNENSTMLKEFHLSYFCQNDKCNKKHSVDDPGFLVAMSYRHAKTNKLLLPPIKETFENYSKSSNEVFLNSLAFMKAKESFKDKIEKNEGEWVLTQHISLKRHAMVIGATGSGKTQKIIFPSIFYNAALPIDKSPTMIVTDPKGEIYKSTSGYLKSRGYSVFVLNYRQPTTSHSYNPLKIAWQYRYDAIFLKKQKCATKTFTTLDSAKAFLLTGEITLNNSKVKIKCNLHGTRQCKECVVEFENEMHTSAYQNGEEIKIYTKSGYAYWKEDDYLAAIDAEIRELRSMSEKELISFGKILISNPKGGEPYWTDGARSYFTGLAITMLEIMDVNPDALPLKKFNVPSILKMMSEKNVKVWFEKYREDKLKALEDPVGADQASVVSNAPDNTKESLISTAKTSTIDYIATSLQGILCSTNHFIDLEMIARGEKPCVIYLIVPDDDKSLHGLAATFVDQFYKTCVKVAGENYMLGKTIDETLTRQIQFYLDEFGNFPEIPSFPQMITVSRSRNIFFLLILQEFSQLDDIYGATNSKNIRLNCNLNIYIRTQSQATAKELSEDYGRTAVVQYNANDNSSRAELKKEQVESGNITSIPLISDDAILKLDQYLVIAKQNGENPALLSTLFSYEVPAIREMQKLSRVFIPTNSVNFMKDHYFNFFSKNLDEWKRYISAAKQDEVGLEIMAQYDLGEYIPPISDEDDIMSLNDLDAFTAEQDRINSLQHKRGAAIKENIASRYIADATNNKISEHVDYNLSSQGTPNSYSHFLYEYEGYTLAAEKVREMLQRNLHNVVKLSEQYNELKHILPRDMTREMKEKINDLWIKKEALQEENYYLLSEMKKRSIKK